MKKPYSKPHIAVESLQLDQPIAAGCTADFDDVLSLVELGYFADDSCKPDFRITIDGPVSGHDTICYHSNVQVAFTS